MHIMQSIIYVVDDDDDVRKGLCRQLESAGYRVEAFASARAFLARPPADAPACLILDVRMPEVSGTELQEHLVAAGSDLPIIFLSGHADVPMSVKAMKRGAMDFLQKPADDQTLLDAVAGALEKSRTNRARQAEVTEARARLGKLTPREMDVFKKVITGALNKQIAHDLGVVEQTVKFHRGAIMQKLDVESVAELVRLAAKAGIEPG